MSFANIFKHICNHIFGHVFETLTLAFDQVHKNIFGQSASLFCDGTEISILIINIQFNSQNNKIISSALSLLLLIFLNSAGNTEAKPTVASQPHNSDDNDSFLWLGELENPSPDQEEIGLGDEKLLHVQLYITQ